MRTRRGHPVLPIWVQMHDCFAFVGLARARLHNRLKPILGQYGRHPIHRCADGGRVLVQAFGQCREAKGAVGVQLGHNGQANGREAFQPRVIVNRGSHQPRQAGNAVGFVQDGRQAGFNVCRQGQHCGPGDRWGEHNQAGVGFVERNHRARHVGY